MREPLSCCCSPIISSILLLTSLLRSKFYDQNSSDANTRPSNGIECFV